MNEITSTSDKEIDAMLEEAGEALFYRNDAKAASLLNKILQCGNENQRLEAESYLMQLDAIIAMDEDEERSKQSVGDASYTEEELAVVVAQEDSEFEHDPSELFLEVETASKTEDVLNSSAFVTDWDEKTIQNSEEKSEQLTKILENEEDKFLDPFEEDDSLVLISDGQEVSATEEELKHPIAASAIDDRLQEVDQEKNKLDDHKETLEVLGSSSQFAAKDDEIEETEILLSQSSDDSVEKSVTDINGFSEEDEKIDEDSANAVEEKHTQPESVSEGQIDVNSEEQILPSENTESDLSEEDDEEAMLALVQAEMLLDDKEFETAEIVLQSVLNKCSEEQKSRAEAMILQARVALSLSPKKSQITKSDGGEDGDTNGNNTSVIDTIFHEEYEGFSTNRDDLSSSHIEDFESAAVVDEKKSETIDELSSFIVPDDIDKDLLKEIHADDGRESASREMLPAFLLDDEEEIVTTDVFSKDENTSALIPPTLALGNLAEMEVDQEALSTMKVSQRSDLIYQRQGFFVGDLGFMIRFEDGSELTEMPSHCKVPNAPSWMLGLTNLHGVVIPIVDLELFLNLGASETNAHKKPMLLIIAHEEKSIGVVVNGLPTRLTWSDAQKVDTNTSPRALREHIHNACLINGDLWFDLNSDSLCQSLEKSL